MRLCPRCQINTIEGPQPYCKECQAEYWKEWYAANRERKQETDRAWRIDNRERINITQKIWREETGGQREWQRNNGDKMREYARTWRTKNPEKARARVNRYRTRKRQLPNDLTAEDWQDILFAYDHRCAYCMRCDVDLEQEHFIPLSRGGGYTIDNIIPACRACNASKSSNLTSEWVR